MDRMMVRDTSVKPSTETIEWYQLSKCWWGCEEEYLLVDYHKDGDKRNNVHKVFVAKAAGSPPDVFYTSGYKGENDARLHFGFLYMGGESTNLRPRPSSSGSRRPWELLQVPLPRPLRAPPPLQLRAP